MGTILISTLFFAVFGMDSWKWLAVLWALVPAINIYNFATCPIEHLVDEGEEMGIKELFRKPLFWLSMCLMICSGASETGYGTMGICLCRKLLWGCQETSW
ncbi:MAG: hypothetical protein ACLR8P_23340 [Clostridium fessum]